MHRYRANGREACKSRRTCSFTTFMLILLWKRIYKVFYFCIIFFIQTFIFIYSCYDCRSTGSIQCYSCRGSGRIKSYVQINFKFENNQNESIKKPDCLPESLLRSCQSSLIFSEEANEVILKIKNSLIYVHILYYFLA